LAGGDAPDEIRARYHQKVIEKYIGMAFNQITYDTWLTAKKYSNFDILDSFTKRYYLPVMYDTASLEWYIELPVTLAQLPDGTALRHISPKQDQSFAFAPVNNTSSPMWSVLEAGYIKDVPSYYVENTKAFFIGFEPYQDITTVMVKLIPPFSAWDDDSEVPVIAGKEFTIFEMVTKYLVNKPADDDLNDNADQQIK
jgi:hypothetical protein